METTHRSVRVPRLLRMVAGVRAVAEVLDELVPRGRPALLVHSGSHSPTRYGATLATATRAQGHEVIELVSQTNTAASVATVADEVAKVRPGVVVGVGGGRVVDVAKLAAARTEVDFVSVPTQASSDGICSPIAVIVSDDGKPQSLGARIPVGIVADMDALASAPIETWRSGLGDLVSNVSAVRDWRHAHERNDEAIDDFACLTSEAAALSVVEDDADLGDAEYRRKLIRGLILSGIAMEMAGSSRPASGSEHLISHALDELLPQPRLHGLQVALGTIAACLLRGEDCRALAAFYRRVGLPVAPEDLGIEVSDFMQAVRRAPETRPGRWTWLSETSPAALAELERTYRSGTVAEPA
jgi:glycerol-1-phosphate dehydrogenase [NAD(P)+]